MKQIVMGTAGHIDHGKTSLIKALTGTNTDRLKEEQQRGITIELGFAALELPGGQSLGIVDVPGHEKFVKNMVAGATGIDLVVMIIAADEGIMPQTREHLEICTLLGVKFGLVALTKTDLVDEEWLMLVHEEIEDFVKGTFLENAPVVPVSAVTEEGLPELIDSLNTICAAIPTRSESGLFRLPIDRVFTMKGFGTVITGTLISGTIAVGDTVVLYPTGIESKVRGLQVHNQSVTLAAAGMRTAINFQGLEKAVVQRGDIVGAPNTLVPSHMVDVTLHYLESNTKALKNRTRVRFHSGTSEIMGVVVLLDCEQLKPGQKAFAQIRLEEQVSLVRDDRYVLRSYSPVRTIGGGRVINPVPTKHKPLRPEVIEHLKSLINENPEIVTQSLIRATDRVGCSHRDLTISTNLAEKKLSRLLQTLASKKKIVQYDKERRMFIHREVFEKVQGEIGAHLENYHRQFPLKPGVQKEELKSKLPMHYDPKLFSNALQGMLKAGAVVQEEDIVHMAGHTVSLGVDQQTLRDQILAIYKQDALTPKYFKQVVTQLETDPDQADQVMKLLVDEGLIIKVKEDLFYHHQHLSQLQDRLLEHLSSHGDISTPQFKDMTGASRKYVIPLIEYFDRIKLTIRIGDIRKLRKLPNG
ncbi:MAG: selenocysteine-specific translation elongation factor [Desulfobacteraceae bacterium]